MFIIRNSDEKAFEVDVSGLVYWIPYGRPQPMHIQSQVRFRVAIFGAVWYDARSVLVVIGGWTNTTTYVEYLQAALGPHLRRLPGYYLIYDGPTWAQRRWKRVELDELIRAAKLSNL